MTPSITSTLEIANATEVDIPALVEFWFAAFDQPEFRRIWPDTMGVRQWWIDAMCFDMLNRPFQHYIKVIDTGSTDDQGRSRIAAFAKWDFSMPEDRGRRYPRWHEDMPGEVCDAFFALEEANRTRVMGDERHYYLDTVATHPEYRRRGAGSMLLKWGCEFADEFGVGLYVDASKAGAPLYAKFGFVDESEPDTEVASMARHRR